MKKIAFIFTGTLWLLSSSCQEEKTDPALISKLSVTSVWTSATYDIEISRPANYSASNGKYAAIYVLDGEENFDLVTNESRRISDRLSMSNVLVVSIGYGNDRSLDYTPSKTSAATGGAPLFLKFIKDELVPRLEQEFRADTARTQRTILGHSYGGLFGAYAFAADNTLFGNYILLSPSLWFDNEITLLIERDHRSANKDREQVMYMGEGELENAGRMQAPFVGFYNTIRENYPAAKITSNFEKDLDHMGSKNPGILKGLEFYFNNRVNKK